ncbi:MAG: hypothetical protein WD336_00675, partial [Trueperaceae bacterium]
MERVALAGHSRGGEAAAIAAALDRIGVLPDQADAPLTERVGGPHRPRAVVAIAPSDQQHLPGDRPTRLDGVDYLVIHAGHDADVTGAYGDRQYERTTVGPGGVRASMFVHRATHAAFNERWGPFDLPPPLGRLLDRRRTLSGEDQRALTATLVTSFLERSLRGDEGAERIFRDPTVLAAHAPPGAYLTRWDDDRGTVLADYSEDVDPATGTLVGLRIEADGLAVWREGDPGLRG